MIPTSFAQPWWLAGLALPAVIVAWEILSRRRALVLPFDHGEARRGVWLGRFLRSSAILPAILLAIAVVLLARPMRSGKPGAERELTNMEFVVDVSGSMMSEFGTGTRFDGSITAIQAFTTHRSGDAFGMTIFGNDVLHWTPLTKDRDAIRTAVPFLRPENMPPQMGGTEIGKAVRACLQRVRERGTAGGVLILVSDGESADLGNGAAHKIGQELAASGIVLYTIHIGDDQPPADVGELVRPCGGQVFAAKSPEALDVVFSHIDRLQPARLKPTAPRPVDATALPALAGLVILGMYQLSLFGLRYTPW